jgi:hypothetical protein
MSGGSGCAIITGATATAIAAWCGVLVAGTTITTTIITGIITTGTITTGTTITTAGIVTDPQRRCVARAAPGWVCGGSSDTGDPPISCETPADFQDERQMNGLPTGSSERLT